MFTPLRALLSACVAALSATRPCAAASDKSGCPGPVIEADTGFRERFPDLLEQLRSELPARADIDSCAVAELRVRASGIVVAVALEDGRATARDVARREDVLPALQALLLVPEPDMQPAPAVPAAPTATAAEAPTIRTARGTEARVDAPVATPLDRRRDAQPSRVVPTRSFGVELSLVSGVRAGDGQIGYGGGVLSFVELHRWLVGFQGRADGYRSILGSDPETALTLGLLLGRRVDLGSTALDLLAGPAVAMRGANFSQTEPAPGKKPVAPQPPPREPEVGAVPRLLFGAHLGFAPHSVFRTFVGVDGELGPRRQGDATPGSDTSGRMPTFTLGLALGATLGTR